MRHLHVRQASGRRKTSQGCGADCNEKQIQRIFWNHHRRCISLTHVRGFCERRLPKGDSSLLEDTTNIDPYYIGQYEVTQEFYSAVMAGETVTVNGKVFKLEANPSSNRENSLVKGEIQKYRPVESVTWYDAMYFCNVLSRKLGFTEAYTFEIKAVENGHITDANVSRIKTADGYRLPFDYEWEFAARGGDVKAKDFTFAFSGTSAPTYKLDDEFSPYLDNVAWYGFNPSGKTEDQKKSRDPGIYHTRGRKKITKQARHLRHERKRGRMGLHRR